MPHPHRTPAVLVVLVGILGAAIAQAAPPDALERARQLFVQAETDEDAERWSDALDKFRTVSQVRLTAGVRYHVALCEEHLGQLARALADYKAAQDQAVLENAKDVLSTVGKRLATLDARIPRLTIHLIPAAPETSLKLDGEPIAAELAGAPVPIDPGTHRVEARTFDGATSTEVVTLRERESRVIDIHVGGPAVRTSPTPTPTPTSTSTPTSTPTQTPVSLPPHRDRGLAIAATVAALAFAGGGAGAFLLAGSDLDHAIRSCAQVPTLASNACDGLKNRVRAWDFAAAGAWGAALVAGAFAIALWTTPSDASERVGVHWTVGPTAVGVRGRF